MAILMSYWLVNGCTGVLQGVIVAGGRAPALARARVGRGARPTSRYRWRSRR